MKLKIATVFTGIGSFEQSLKKSKINFEILFACDNGERYPDIPKDLENEINSSRNPEAIVKKIYDNIRENNIQRTYEKNFGKTKFFQDIRFLKASLWKNKIDIIVGGSPCQSFSYMGKKKGLEDSRGTLFYDYARIIKESQPKVFIFENVPGLMRHNNGKTWKIIIKIFENLNYNFKYKILNSKDFGLPHNRKRIFVIGFKNKKYYDNFIWPTSIKLKLNAKKYYDKEIDNSFYLGKKGFEFVTNQKYKNRASVNSKIIKCQKAQQQFNWNGDFVFEKIKNAKIGNFIGKAYVGNFNNKAGIIRMMTHKELLSLMGFPKSFKLEGTNIQKYRQIGNSIAVNLFDNIIKKIMDTGVFDE